MQSDLPKALHEVAQAPMLIHTMQRAQQLQADRTLVVVGHGGDHVGAVARQFDPSATIVHQDQQLGTGHAVLQARQALTDFDGNVVILYADTPFVPLDKLQAMIDTLNDGASVAVFGFHAPAPNDYGKLITLPNGSLDAIVENKDATTAQRAISLCNSGVMGAPSRLLFELLDQVDAKNASGEFYLTDIVGKARAKDLNCAVIHGDAQDAIGVNSRADLNAAQDLFQRIARAKAIENGAQLWAPETVFFAYDTQIGRDCIIEPHVVFGPKVVLESNVHIRAFCHIEGAYISQGARIGPYARVRADTQLGANSRIGNFVEIKAAKLEEGAKVNHLSYVGDADIGARANIGAGTITCNYDGVFKHKTTIGADAFIGSNSALVAPVNIGRNAMTASGSVITSDVPDDALGIARARQENKPGFAARLMAKLRAKKQKKAD